MSAGNGAASRIYHSEDGGKNWTQQFRNGNSQGVLRLHVVLGRQARRSRSAMGWTGSFRSSLTKNGKDWALLSEAASPHSRSGEGSFAASGTCIATRNGRYAWFGTGAAAEGYARVFRTTDAGRTWSCVGHADRDQRVGRASPRWRFRDLLHGVAAGGNIAKPDTFLLNVAVTSDGGVTWYAGEIPPFPGPVYGAAYAMNGRGPCWWRWGRGARRSPGMMPGRGPSSTRSATGASGWTRRGGVGSWGRGPRAAARPARREVASRRLRRRRPRRHHRRASCPEISRMPVAGS